MTKKATALVSSTDAPQPMAAVPAVHSEAAAIFSMLQRVTLDQSIPIERVDQAWNFYTKVQAEESRKAYIQAMASAQAEMEPIRKDANNPQTKSKYATFDALDRAARPFYTKHGFVVTHGTERSDIPDHVKVVTMISHTGGHERRYEIDMPADGKGAKGGDVMTKTHAVGSAFSYGKRYNFGGAFNLVTTERDDDGNAAGGGNAEPITAEQIATLNKLMEETDTDASVVCDFFTVQALDAMTSVTYAKAFKMLTAKKKKMGAQ